MRRPSKPWLGKGSETSHPVLPVKGARTLATRASAGPQKLFVCLASDHTGKALEWQPVGRESDADTSS